MEIYLEEAKVEDGSEDGVVIIKDKKTKENY